MAVRTDIPSHIASALLVQALENREEFGVRHPGLEQSTRLLRFFGNKDSVGLPLPSGKALLQSWPFFLPSSGVLGPAWVLMANPQGYMSLPASP